MRKVVLTLKEKQKYDVIKKLVETNGNKERARIKLGLKSIRQINRLIAGYIDDATGHVVAEYFDNQETLNGYYHVYYQVLTKYGIPYLFKTDKRTVFEYNKKGTTLDEDNTFTQFAYACNQLGTSIETSSVPEFKPRIERLFESFQLRLIPELRLANVTSIEEANNFLPSFIDKYNSKFALCIDKGVNYIWNFDKFHNAGYKGLYNGETADDVAKRKGLRYREDILDNMGSTELIANLFRISQTEEKLKKDNVQTESEACKAHNKIGKIVRKAIKEAGGTMPEDLPTPEKSLKQLKKEIDEGFDEEIKSEYYNKVNELQEILNQKKKKIKRNILYFVLICYLTLGVVCIFKLIKYIFERKLYYHEYYRDFPNDDKAYIIDYLMNKKVTTKTLLVTILDLISQNKILIHKSSKEDDDYVFTLPSKELSVTTVEKEVIEILFDVIGSNKQCSLKDLKNYGKNEYNSNTLYKKYLNFVKKVQKEIEYKNYFKKESKIQNFWKNCTILIMVISLILGLFLSTNEYISVLNYYILAIVIGIIYYIILSKDKNRTKKGAIEYSKWLAHKRFLKDFGRFDSKELKEIVLWDRYFVTAVTLGCSDKVLEKMEMYIIDWETVEEVRNLLLQYQIHRSIDNLKRTLNSLLKEAKSHSNIRTSTGKSGGYSSGTSGDGFGGGSSSGGSGGGGGGWSRF